MTIAQSVTEKDVARCETATVQPSIEATECIGIALDAAASMAKSGGPTTAANQLFTNLLRMFRTDVPTLSWRSDFILGSGGGQSGGQSSIVRPLGGVSVNLMRASELSDLTERASKEQMSPVSVASELKRIESLPSPYSRWITILAAGVTAGAFSQLAVRNLGTLGVVFLAAVVGQYVRTLLVARKVPGVTTTLLAGIVSALLAAVGLRLGLSKAVTPTLIASVMYMAPGLPLINGFLDMASQKYLITGLERIANAGLLFLAMAIAIGFAYLVVM